MLQSSRKINATGIITEVCKEYKEGFKKKRVVNFIWESQENIYWGGVKLVLPGQNRVGGEHKGSSESKDTES